MLTLCHPSHKYASLCGIFLIGISLVCALYNQIPVNVNIPSLRLLSILSVLVIFVYFTIRKQIKPKESWVQPDVLCIIFLWCINFGYVIQLSFGLIEENSRCIYSYKYFTKAVFISFYGLLALISGFLLGPYCEKSDNQQNDTNALLIHRMKLIGRIFLIASSLGILFFLIVIASFIFGEGYGSEGEAQAGSILRILYMFTYNLLLAGLCLLFTSSLCENKRLKIFDITLLFFNLFLFAIYGDRTPWGHCLFALGILHSEKGLKPIKGKSLLFLFVFGLLVFHAIQLIRVTDKSVQSIITVSNNIKDMSHGDNPLENLGFQITIVDRVLYLLESENSTHSYGLHYPREILQGLPFSSRLFPFIYSKLPPTTMNVVYKRTYPQNEIDGSGIGGNLIADLYYTAGGLGVVMFSFLIGYLIDWFQVKVRLSSSLFFLWIYILVTTTFIVGIRNSTLSEVIRFGLWSLGLLYLVSRRQKLCMLLPSVIPRSKLSFK